MLLTKATPDSVRRDKRAAKEQFEVVFAISPAATGPRRTLVPYKPPSDALPSSSPVRNTFKTLVIPRVAREGKSVGKEGRWEEDEDDSGSALELDDGLALQSARLAPALTAKTAYNRAFFSIDDYLAKKRLEDNDAVVAAAAAVAAAQPAPPLAVQSQVTPAADTTTETTSAIGRNADAVAVDGDPATSSASEPTATAAAAAADNEQEEAWGK